MGAKYERISFTGETWLNFSNEHGSSDDTSQTDPPLQLCHPWCQAPTPACLTAASVPLLLRFVFFSNNPGDGFASHTLDSCFERAPCMLSGLVSNCELSFARPPCLAVGCNATKTNRALGFEKKTRVERRQSASSVAKPPLLGADIFSRFEQICDRVCRQRRLCN